MCTGAHKWIEPPSVGGGLFGTSVNSCLRQTQYASERHDMILRSQGV